MCEQAVCGKWCVSKLCVGKWCVSGAGGGGEEEEAEDADGSAQPRTRTPHKDAGKKIEHPPHDLHSNWCQKKRIVSTNWKET